MMKKRRLSTRKSIHGERDMLRIKEGEAISMCTEICLKQRKGDYLLEIRVFGL